MVGFATGQFECLLGSHTAVAGERQLALSRLRLDQEGTAGYCSLLEWTVGSHTAGLPA